MINDDNSKNWEGIKKVIIFYTSDLDSVFATRITYENIREKYNVTDIDMIDITTKYPVPVGPSNPCEDTVVIYIGKIPNMMHVDRTIEMVGANHVMVLINNPTYIDYFYKYSFTKNMMGLLIREMTLYEISYLYWVKGSRYCDTDCHYSIITGNELITPVNGKGSGPWSTYRDQLKNKKYLEINETFNDAIQSAEVKPSRNLDNMNIDVYFGIRYNLPAIDDDSGFIWNDIYLREDGYFDPEVIDIYYDDGEFCKTEEFKRNIQNFRDFAFTCTLRKVEKLGLSMVAINQPFTGVWSFLRPEIYNNYHIGIEFCYNGRMHYRIYRLGKEPNTFVPIRRIAEAYGGAGNDYVGTFQTCGTLELAPISKP